MFTDFFVHTLNWLAQQADPVNALCAALVAALGIGLRITKRNVFFKDRKFLSHAFLFWLLQWFVFISIYIVRFYYPGPPNVWLLVLVDLQSVCAVTFFLVFLFGETYEPDSILTSMAILLVIVVLVDFGLGLHAVRTPAGSGWRYAWIALSEVLSATALIMMGGVFVLRYGLIALPLLITSGVYAAIQRPIYSGVFVNLNPQPKWFLAAAAGKLLMASLFYLYFFARLQRYQALNLPAASPEITAALGRRLVRIWSPIAAVFLAFLEELARHAIFK